MRRLTRVSLILSSLFAACVDVPGPGAPPSGPYASISDGAHEGAEGFYFLPPLVPEPVVNGTFDPAFLPLLRVIVCEWDGTACVGAPVAEFTSETGSGSETLRVDVESEHYIVNWHTDESILDPARDYRLLVMAGPTEFGHADVDVVSSGKDLKNVDTGQYIALKDGRTLPIKFRIEEGFGDPGEILFSSSVDGSFDTWAISLDGTVRTNLSRVSHDPNGIFEDGGGRWSPDGSRIMFTSNKTPGVPRKIFIMNADGSDAQPMNNNANTEVDPSWGGDGTRIYYGRNPRFPATTGAGCGPCPFWEIYEYNLTTGQETRLTFNNSRDEHAVASPDGNFIAFRRAERPNDCCNPTSVWIMDIDGQNQRRLSPNNNQYETPLDWDPVNNKILTAWSSAVVLMDPDGTAEQLITGATGAAFSPDGTTILVDVGADIYFLDIATRRLTPFLVEPGAQHPSDWRATGNATSLARAAMSRAQLPGTPANAAALVAIGSFEYDPLGLEGCDLGIFAGPGVASGQHLALAGSGVRPWRWIRAWSSL